MSQLVSNKYGVYIRAHFRVLRIFIKKKKNRWQ